jgi:hypothetical protein
MADNFPRYGPPAPLHTALAATKAPWTSFLTAKPLHQCTCIFGGGGATGPDLVVGMTNRLAIPAHLPGSPVYAVAWCDGAPAGGPVNIDITYNGVSMLQSPIVIPDGSTDLVYVTNFVINPTQKWTLQLGGLLQGKITLVGTSSPGKSAVLEFFWQPQS